MNLRLAAACALLLALGAYGCGDNAGDPLGYTPEGQPNRGLLFSDVQPDTRLTVVFTDTLTNTGDSRDTLEFTGGSADFPAGTVFGIFRNDGVTPFPDTNKNHIADTGPVDSAGVVLVQVHATLPGGSVGGPYTAALTATSVNDPHQSATAINTLGEIYPAVRATSTESALPGPLGEALGRATVAPGPGTITLTATKFRVAPARTDAIASLTFGGQSIAQAWPTFSDRLLVTGLIMNNTTVDGFRIYANPGGQGFRPAEDFIASPTAVWPTGWNYYSIPLTTFDPTVGTDLVGRGSRGGIESGSAPLTEHSFLPIATPTELVHREDVTLISPADSAATDSIPVLKWNPTAGASRYLVQVIGRNGLQYLALTDQTSHRVESTSGLIIQDLPMRDGLQYRWGVIAVDVRNRIIGFTRASRAFFVHTH